MASGSITAIVDAEEEAKQQIKRAKEQCKEIQKLSREAGKEEIRQYEVDKDQELQKKKAELLQEEATKTSQGSQQSEFEKRKIEEVQKKNQTTVVEQMLNKVLTVQIGPMGTAASGKPQFVTLFNGEGMAA